MPKTNVTSALPFGYSVRRYMTVPKPLDDGSVSRWSSNRWSWKVTNRCGCVAIQGHKSTSFPERSPTCKRRECSRTPHSSANIKTLASQPSLVNPGPKGSDNIDSLAVSPTPETSKYTFPSAELCRHVSSFNVFFISQNQFWLPILDGVWRPATILHVG